MVVPSQSALSRVVEATYFGCRFRDRAIRLLSSMTVGQYSAQIS
jgi:hypothetical protein